MHHRQPDEIVRVDVEGESGLAQGRRFVSL
jgi:hypothetical protein